MRNLIKLIKALEAEISVHPADVQIKWLKLTISMVKEIAGENSTEFKAAFIAHRRLVRQSVSAILKA